MSAKVRDANALRRRAMLRADPRLDALPATAGRYDVLVEEKPGRAAAQGYYAGFCPRLLSLRSA